jgi:hypothetical protein
MPYTDLRPHHGRLRLTTSGCDCPLGTVIDRCWPLVRGPRTAPAASGVASTGVLPVPFRRLLVGLTGAEMDLEPLSLLRGS